MENKATVGLYTVDANRERQAKNKKKKKCIKINRNKNFQYL